MIPYLLKTFRGGISDEANKGVVGSFKHGYGLDIHKRTDSLSCGSTMATVLGESVGVFGTSSAGSTMTGIINVFLPTSDGSMLAFSERGSIWCVTGDGQWQFVHNDPNGSITGAEEHKDINGANYIYWATSTAVARKAWPGVTVPPDSGTARWSDAVNVYKTENIYTDLNNTNWHSMKKVGGDLMICNLDTLAVYSYTAVFDPATVQLTPGTVAQCLEERNDFVIIGSNQASQVEESHIWSWVTTAVNPVQKKKIPSKGVNSLIYTELPLLQAGANGEIFFSDFSNAIPISVIPGGGRVSPSGTTIESNLALFGIYGGTAVSYPGIWSYGRKNKNRPFSLNYNYKLASQIGGSTISTIGALINFNGITFASWGTEDSHTSTTTNEYGVDCINSTTSASAIFENLEFDAGKTFETKWVDTVKIATVPMAASTSYSVKFKMDKETDWRYAILPNNTTTYALTNSIGSEWQLGSPGKIYEVGVELNPSGGDSPEILSITSYLNDRGYLHG